MGWGGKRKNTGGKRKKAGRKYKFYQPIILAYRPSDSRENICRLCDDLTILSLADKIPDRKLASIAHLMDTALKAKTPSLQEEKLLELETLALETRKMLDAGNTDQTEQPRSEESNKSTSKGSGSVDSKDKDSETATV